MTAREGASRRWRLTVPRSFSPMAGDAAARHRVVLWVLAAHLPLILVFGVRREEWGVLAGGLVAVGVAVVAAMFAPRAFVREACASVGLSFASICLMWMSTGSPEMALHGMVVAVLVSLYQDWRVQALALVPFALWFVIGGLVNYAAVFGDGTGTVGDVIARSVVRLGFLVAVMAASRGFWSAVERLHRQEAEYRSQLHEIEAVALGRMREAREVREALVATASHEFRTPLTTIRGNAVTLRTHGDRLPPEDREQLIDGIIASGERLSGLLEDMLAAVSAAKSSPDEVSDVREELGRFATGAPPGRIRLELRSPAGLRAAIRPDALQRIVGALVAHAQENADSGNAVLIRAVPDRSDSDARDLDGAPVELVEISLIYRGEPLSPSTMAQLFEPFGSREAARTGKPSSLRLYVMRRLSEASGGSVAVEAAGRRTVIHVRLPAPPPTAAPGTPDPSPGGPDAPPDAQPGAPRSEPGLDQESLV